MDLQGGVGGFENRLIGALLSNQPLILTIRPAAAAIYGTPPERLAEHGYLRAEAMRIRDRRAAEGGVTDDDWSRIEALLVDCYRSLVGGVNEPAPKTASGRREPGKLVDADWP